jgi:Carboxypeptidase regulatory-like domain
MTRRTVRSPYLLFSAINLLLFLCVPAWLSAQLDRGEVTGTVQDASGAVVAKALIVLTNANTGVRNTTQSTATGTYVLDDVLPGRYTVEVQAPGFEKYVAHDVLIQVQLTTLDAHLATGSVQETVSVTAATPLLQAESAQVGQSISNQAVNELPLATRDWDRSSVLRQRRR